MNLNPSKVLLGFAVMVVATGSPDRATGFTLFTDKVFTMNSPGWSRTEIGDGGIIFDTQILSGGNPGAFFGVTTHVFNAPPGGFSRITGIYLNEFAEYKPTVQGAISKINYSEDARLFSGVGNGQGIQPALRQDGKDYLGPLMTSPDFSWVSKVRNGLTANNFVSTADGTSHPDFSAGGEPITFGFARRNTTTGGQFTNVGGIDNWRVEVVTKPKVILAWGHDAPWEVREVKISKSTLYLNDFFKKMPAYTNSDSAAFQVFKAVLLTQVEELFVNSGIEGIEFVNGAPEPGATVIYFTNPIGGLLGMSFGDRFNRHSSAEAVVAIQDGAFGEIVEQTAETVAHEIGHTFGLEHIDPPNPEIMDYDHKKDEPEIFSDRKYRGRDLQGGGGRFRFTTNPAYHLKRYVLGVPATELESTGPFGPGTWDIEGRAFVQTKTKLEFLLPDGGLPSDVTLYDAHVIANDGESDDDIRMLGSFPVISLADLSQQTFTLFNGEGLSLIASTLPGSPTDIALALGNPIDTGVTVFPDEGTMEAFLQVEDSGPSGYRTLAGVTISAVFIPEPSTLGLVALASFTLIMARRRAKA